MGVNGVLGLYFLPIFLSLILSEYFHGRSQGKQLYTGGETIASILIALGQRVIALLPLGLSAMVAIKLHEYPARHWFGLVFGPPGWKPFGEGILSADLRERYGQECRQT